MIEVTAELTASVVRVAVGADDEVAEGDTLLLVESMKMEIPIAAPHAGRVVRVEVEPGDVIAEGDLLAVIDEGGIG